MLAAMGHARKAAKSFGEAPLTFKMLTLDGASVDFNDVAMGGNWLVVYVHNATPLTEQFLQTIRKEDLPTWNGRVIVIGANLQPDQVKNLMLACPDFPEAAWYADPDRKAGAFLHLGVAPAVSGMRDMNPRWALAGSLLMKGTRLKDASTQWIDKEAEMDRNTPPASQR